MQKVIFRIDEILKYCKNRSVLHFGFVQHSHLYESLIAKNEWVHGQIAPVARRLVGIDFLKEDVEKIKEKYGYEGYYGDATDLSTCTLNEKFDVIVCGELIEHLTNPGLMLEGIKKFMNKDSLLIITTPNAWGLSYLLQVKKSNNEKNWVNPEHVHWYSFFTLANTLDRHGFKEVSYDYYYFFETREKYFKVSPGLIGRLKLLNRRLMIKNTVKQLQTGLFFAAQLK
jgi:SAM-dependent methyltransferase